MRRVAVTGFGVVSPLGTGRSPLWKALAAGRSGIGAITRFDATTFEVHLAAEVKDSLPLPGEIASVAAIDPKAGFAYAACEEALVEASIARLGPETLVHLGTSVEIFHLGKLVTDGRPDFRAAVLRGLSEAGELLQSPLDSAARAIRRRWGTPGRSLTSCSACAAGAQAVGHGFREVRAGRFDVAVCGGFDSMVHPLGVGGFQLLGALSTDNARGALACRPFDAARAGTVVGEGAAVAVLEPLERARAEGKRVLAEVVGYGSTLDAYGLTAPDPDGAGAARCMRAALRDAGVGPERIGHINAHGTGTRLNDAIEARAIREVFRGEWERIPVSATKSMTGHLIGAAGAVELGACLLALVESTLPPNPALETVGRDCELRHVTGRAEPFHGEFVLTNSFGFGGQNATLILRRSDG